MARAIPLSDLPVYSLQHLPVPEDDYLAGAVFLVNKPKGWSSFRVVKLIKKCLDMGKVGHAGTLDPMAEGLLVICCGKATKTIGQIQLLEKEYVGEITFGSATASYDAETEVTETAPWDHLDETQIREKLQNSFTGDLIQYAPVYSALKHKGQPLYKLVRQGKKVERKPRVVTIHEIRLLDCNLPRIRVQVRCGKGTYIRSIADDLGRSLKSVAHLTALLRTATGTFRSENALSTEQLYEIFNLS